MRTIVFFVPIFLLISVSCSRNETVQPQRKEITDAVFASGNIVDEDQYLVIAATEAYLDKSLVKEGDTVKAGAMLFLLSNEIQSAQFESARTNYNDAKVRNDVNSPQLQELKLQIEQGKAQVMNDERNFNRYANLVKTGAVSKAEYDKVKLQYDASQSNLAILGKSFGDMKLGLELRERNASDQLKIQQRNNKDYLVAANYNGIVLSVEKNQGEFLRRGETIAKIGAGNRMIKLSIAEEDISRIKLNDKVVVSLNTDTQKNYLARITKIYPSFDTKEQAFIAEAHFQNIPAHLMYNTQLQANIIIAEKANALIIPAKFVSNDDTVELSSGKRVKISKGISNSEWVEVLDGITGSESIVIQKTSK